MTATHPARPFAAGRLPRVPFPVVDEVDRHCAQDAEPSTIHIEIHLPGRLEEDRLRAAFAASLALHPRVLMRERPRGPFARRYEWELTAGPDRDPVGFAPAAPGALDRARAESLDTAPPLALSPPLRITVVEEPGREGCVLVVAVHHTALDGPACLRVVATAAEIYGGRSADQPSAPARPQAAPPPAHAGPAPLARPARVAAGTPGRCRATGSCWPNFRCPGGSRAPPTR
ncbi:hypothetical protein Smic_03710 [Streptomyces microflavus]|uniref:Condensation domain-containing protein n=1 Tax=Streptomyces microflavus TaxID=1919 RepID=A0A7J0CJ64_STRMI|nr:hypothetical protein Smic_03710 [Streptomyces microflavus]